MEIRCFKVKSEENTGDTSHCPSAICSPHQLYPSPTSILYHCAFPLILHAFYTTFSGPPLPALLLHSYWDSSARDGPWLRACGSERRRRRGDKPARSFSNRGAVVVGKALGAPPGRECVRSTQGDRELSSRTEVTACHTEECCFCTEVWATEVCKQPPGRGPGGARLSRARMSFTAEQIPTGDILALTARGGTRVSTWQAMKTRGHTNLGLLSFLPEWHLEMEKVSAGSCALGLPFNLRWCRVSGADAKAD